MSLYEQVEKLVEGIVERRIQSKRRLGTVPDDGDDFTGPPKSRRRPPSRRRVRRRPPRGARGPAPPRPRGRTGSPTPLGGPRGRSKPPESPLAKYTTLPIRVGEKEIDTLLDKILNG